jgi:PAS domain S-box-containing protein
MGINEAAFVGEAFTFSERAMSRLGKVPRAGKGTSGASISLNSAMRVLLERGGGADCDAQLKTVLADVSNAMLEGIVVCGTRGRILYVNENLCHMLGRTREEMVESPAAQFFGELAAQWRRAARDGGAAERYEAELRTATGRTIAVEVASRQIRDADGRMLGRFAVLMDITARSQALRESEGEVRLLSAQFMAAQELERQRIARELHDSVGQGLAGVKFGLETCEAQIADGACEAAARTLTQFAGRIQSVLDEVRRISMDLRPSTLDDLGILPTLGWFTREFRTISDQIELQVQIDLHEHEIALPVKTAIYRIVQEAFNNVVSHSGARQVRLALRRVAGQIELRIHDDGTGFDPAAFKVAGQTGLGLGLGLGSMRERAEVTGGRFTLQSETGRGTTVLVRWSLYRSRAGEK